MKTILLVGGLGYIGSHVLLNLVESMEYKLVVFDNLSTGSKDVLNKIKESTGVTVDFVKGDILNKEDLDRLFGSKGYKFDVVIHFAALIEAGLSMFKPLGFFENNVSGTINILKTMHKYNVRKFLFSSTAAVYGMPENGVAKEGSKVGYENYYGESKYFVEQILKSLTNPKVSEDEKVDSVILRYFNPAGADPKGRIGQNYPNPTHLIARAINTALGKQEELVVFGNDYDTPDGTCIRDYIHITDLASAHSSALKYLLNNTGTNTFNIGRGKGVSVLEIIKILEGIHGEFKWRFGERRAGDPASYFADTTKANKLLDWKATLDEESMVRDAYKWELGKSKKY